MIKLTNSLPRFVDPLKMTLGKSDSEVPAGSDTASQSVKDATSRGAEHYSSGHSIVSQNFMEPEG
jgi:hypothetical protein